MRRLAVALIALTVAAWAVYVFRPATPYDRTKRYE